MFEYNKKIALLHYCIISKQCYCIIALIMFILGGRVALYTVTMYHCDLQQEGTGFDCKGQLVPLCVKVKCFSSAWVGFSKVLQLQLQLQSKDM